MVNCLTYTTGISTKSVRAKTIFLSIEVYDTGSKCLRQCGFKLLTHCNGERMALNVSPSFCMSSYDNTLIIVKRLIHNWFFLVPFCCHLSLRYNNLGARRTTGRDPWVEQWLISLRKHCSKINSVSRA